MKNVKLIIEYDGTDFSGWQSQPNARTVQESIERALKHVMKKEIKIHGSGRTDAGVHALGQVASFCENFSIPVHKIPLALNAHLPSDVVIKDAIQVDEQFHARYSAKGKKYRYKIYMGKMRSAIYRNYTYFVPYNLDVCKMLKASKHFLGTHDFKGFMASGSSVKNTVRSIYDLSIKKDKDLLIIDVEGNGFLYNMVRILSGTLVEVGRNRIEVEDIPKILDSKRREKAGHTAPPQGLYLRKVLY